MCFPRDNYKTKLKIRRGQGDEKNLFQTLALDK
jgi:hypothetical protein